MRTLRRIGLHAVGGPVPGLALQVTQTDGNDIARSWVLRALVAGKRRPFGLGPYPAVTLAEARGRAEHMHRDIREHRNPALRQRSPSADLVQSRPPTMTFEAAALQSIEERRPSWKSAKHAAQWESTLRTYAFPQIGSVAVEAIDRVMVLRIIKPVWNDKTETANRVRDWINLVLGWAKAHGLHEGDSPAEWRGNLERALAAPEKVSRPLHQPALPVSGIGGFMRRLSTEQKDLMRRVRWSSRSSPPREMGKCAARGGPRSTWTHASGRSRQSA